MKATPIPKPKRFTLVVRHRDQSGVHEVSTHHTVGEARQHMHQAANIAAGNGKKHYMSEEGHLHILKHKSDETESTFWIRDTKRGKIAKALLYKPSTGESTGTIQHKGQTLRFAKPTLGNKIRAFLGGEKFMANRPLPPSHLTPHAVSRGLSPVHSTMRGMGMQYRSSLGPVAGLKHAEFSHTVSHPHNTAGETIHALHARLSATHKVTKPLWSGRSWGFTATAKDGTRHHFAGAENAHVRDIHNSFATFGNVRVKTGQEKTRAGGHRYTHQVQTAMPGVARDVFAQHFAQKGYVVRKVANGLHLTHAHTGVSHKLMFHQAPQLGQGGTVPPPPAGISPTPAQGTKTTARQAKGARSRKVAVAA